MVRREIGRGGINWSDLAQDGDRRRVVVNTVVNLRVTQNLWKIIE
jgi:hypothetical protein